jgi:VanZ family protein
MPLSDDPTRYLLLGWVSPAAQNVLHVPAFAALSWAWAWALRAWLRAQVGRVAGACVIASVYGVFDEWHQSFVPGRYGSLGDVALDALGAVLGVLLAASFAPAASSADSTPG